VKNIKRHIIKKRIHEVPTNKNYSGEASPYWDHMLEIGDVRNAEMKVQEDPLANPDMVSDEVTPYTRALSERGKLMLQAVQEAMVDLTPQQQAIVRLMHEGVWSENEGQRLYTEQAIAVTLGIARSTVNTILTRVKAKIRRRYEILKTTKDA
jgi:DNA-binding CsgD family transcriptional regulator